MELRPYQIEAVEAVATAWKNGWRRVLVVLPTGCGKTIVFAEVIRQIASGKIPPDPESPDTAHRVMVLAHREELIWQAQDKIAKNAGCSTGVEMGEWRAIRGVNTLPEVIISTIQTQGAGGRMAQFDPLGFAAVVVDEAHHAPAESYINVIAHYAKNPGLRVLGVTATPKRADEKALKAMFDYVAYEYPYPQAIADGWLVPIRQRVVTVDQLDFSKIRSIGGDLNQKELSQILEEENILHEIAAPVYQLAKKRKTLIFAASVRQAERLTQILNRYVTRGRNEAPILVLGQSTYNRAEYISGAMPKNERRSKLAAYQTGEIQYLINVGVLTEGFDDAGVELVVMARPTESTTLYTQMIGRGTRPATKIADKLGACATAEERRRLIRESQKPYCEVLDFVGNAGKHSLVSAVDILGGKYDPQTLGIARQMLRERPSTEEPEDIEDILAKAEEKRHQRERDEAAARLFVRVKAKYNVEDIDPTDPYGLWDQPAQKAPNRKRLTEKQRNIILERYRVEPEKLGLEKCHRLLDEHFRRIERGLSTIGQMQVLRKHGIFAPMTFTEASRTIDSIRKGRIK